MPKSSKGHYHSDQQLYYWYIIVVFFRLSHCDITDEGCDALASVLRSNPSHLRKLDLSENKLGDSGLKLLSAGLENSDVKLEILV